MTGPRHSQPALLGIGDAGVHSLCHVAWSRVELKIILLLSHVGPKSSFDFL